MIQFPGDQYRKDTNTQFLGGYRNTGGAERFGTIDANKINVYDIQANTASIRDASITTAKIGNLQVTTALIANLAVEEGKIGNLAVTNAKINDLSAAKINTGTLTVGSGGATAIAIKHTGAKTDAIVRWEGGSGIWEDGDNYLGLWGYGGQMYFWCAGDTDPRIVLVTGTNQNSIYGGLRIHTVGGAGGNLNVEGGMVVDGSKSAALDTKFGKKLVYSAESPEVWLFDFCKSTKNEDIDSMFLEVTEGPKRFIKLVDGGYQVWRRRKGYADKRFESATLIDIIKDKL